MTPTASRPGAAPPDDTIRELGRLFADVLEKGMHLYAGTSGRARESAADRTRSGAGRPRAGRPRAGRHHRCGPRAAGHRADLRRRQRRQDPRRSELHRAMLDEGTRRRMVDMRITRLVKDADSGGGELRDDRRRRRTSSSWPGVHAPLDVVEQFGVDQARDEALDTTTRLAIGAGFDAMRDAGIPLVMRYKTTTLGTQLPDRWGLPEALRDETGVIFASAFPGYDRFAEAVEGYALDRGRRESLLAVEGLRARMGERRPGRGRGRRGASPSCAQTLEREPYQFDRRFLFRVPVDGPLAVRRDHRRARARTRRSTPRARAPPRPCRWPRTGSARGAAAGSSSSPPTTPPASTCCRGSPPASSPPGPPPPTSGSRTPPRRSTAAATG